MSDDAPRHAVIVRNIEDEMKESYLRYSMSVIIARALPDVRDGLKPSQRRILYAMLKLNLSPQSKFRKCAKISGDTSGDYHPHGEQVIYPTLVRMAQDWAMRYPLIQGQGNFGSIDGDPPAAMRYTEARLTSAAIALMEDLEKETVEMVPNYDETKREPLILPSLFPNLLCNGSSGIAVGMATNIPSHNLGEVVQATKLLLDNPDATIDDIMRCLPAPDFPTGGIICGYRGIREAYNTGRGKILLRGVLHVEEEQEKQRLVIDEIPYNVNKSRLIEQLADLVNDKVLNGVADLRDDSDKDGMRIVLELKRGEIAEVTINRLYKYSDLQVTFGCNMLALDKGLPRTLNIKQMLSSWIEHRIEVIKRRTLFDLRKAESRVHLLEGYLKAIQILDEVVALIRRSSTREEAKKELVTCFGFTEKQAQAILELRLYQITALEREKIQREQEELLEKIAYYRSLLADEGLVRGVIKGELEELVRNQNSPRRTQIIAAEGEVEMEDLIANDGCIITLSEDDYIKRMAFDLFREQRRGGQGVAGMGMKKEEDVVKGVYSAQAHDHLLIFTNLGRCHWLKVWQIPEAGRKAKGKPLINLLEGLHEGERIATVVPVSGLHQEACLLFATRCGVVKKMELSEFSHPRRKGIAALAIDEGDQLIGARLVVPGQQVMLFTHRGMAIRFDEAEVRAMGRAARGVKGASLREEKDHIVACEIVCGNESLLVVCENGFGKRSLVEEFRKTHRGSVGVRSIITNERNGNVVGATCVTNGDQMVLMSGEGQTVRIGMGDLRVLGRNTQGVKLVNLRESDTLVAIQKLVAEEAKPETDSPSETTPSPSTEPSTPREESREESFDG